MKVATNCSRPSDQGSLGKHELLFAGCQRSGTYRFAFETVDTECSLWVLWRQSQKGVTLLLESNYLRTLTWQQVVKKIVYHGNGYKYRNPSMMKIACRRLCHGSNKITEHRSNAPLHLPHYNLVIIRSSGKSRACAPYIASSGLVGAIYLIILASHRQKIICSNIELGAEFNCSSSMKNGFLCVKFRRAREKSCSTVEMRMTQFSRRRRSDILLVVESDIFLTKNNDDGYDTTSMIVTISFLVSMNIKEAKRWVNEKTKIKDVKIESGCFSRKQYLTQVK